jgi:vitamin B12/bleomycin/antimicrobial peptide transport system ATP-binding/permease protein
VNSFLAQVVGNWWDIMRRQKLLSWFSSGYSQIATVFPFLVAAPRYFSGALELGGLMQTVGAFGEVQTALSWFVTTYPSLAGWRATIDRLSGFEIALGHTPNDNGRMNRIEARKADGITVAGLNVYLPDGSPLLEKVSFDLPAGSRTLVSGPSGSGKSTLLRALSGIWPYCDGQISLPEGNRALFCPQKPYLPLGTFRDLVSYPGAPGAYGDKAIRAAVSKCGLDGFVGRLDENANWTLQLSPGEQQRVAFARALLQRPDWLFLDEATSALDEEAESNLYTLIIQELAGCAIVSVAHRKNLDRFHKGSISLAKQHGSGAAGSQIVAAARKTA